MVWPGQQILSFVAQGYDFVIFTDLNIMFEMFNEITTHEKVPIIRLYYLFFQFCFTIEETAKIVLKSFIRFYKHIYIYTVFQLKAHVRH